MDLNTLRHLAHEWEYVRGLVQGHPPARAEPPAPTHRKPKRHKPNRDSSADELLLGTEDADQAPDEPVPEQHVQRLRIRGADGPQLVPRFDAVPPAAGSEVDGSAPSQPELLREERERGSQGTEDDSASRDHHELRAEDGIVMEDASSVHSRDAEEPVDAPLGNLHLVGDAMGNEPLAPGVQYVYRPLPGLDKDADLEEEKVPDADRDWCFLCQTRENPAALAGHPGLQKLETVRLDNFASVQPRVLAKMMQDCYNEHLRPHIMPRSEQRHWSLKTIRAHVEEHAPDRYTDTVGNLRVIRSVVRILAGNIRMCNPVDESDVKVDSNHVKLLAQMVKVGQQLSADAEELMNAQKGRM